jgi:hypothetical protein
MKMVSTGISGSLLGTTYFKCNEERIVKEN